jgi:predicted P-loop ATPase
VYLQQNYEFRFNVLSGKMEFCPRREDTVFTHLDKKMMNGILMCVLRDLPDEKNVKDVIKTIIYSPSTPDYNPVQGWLDALPEWDGRNRVSHLFEMIPGITAEQVYWSTVWLRSAVAHWRQMDTLYGNECVPTLIGEQGCGKSTFCKRLLPAHLREYYLDHVNLRNKHDKEMALTNNLLVNIDEMDQITHRQQPELKQMLSKSQVNGRMIYGREQSDRLRYASFIATTNNPHPLHDSTGSRRFICIAVAKGQLIDTTSEIDYEQLYAQVLHELRNDKAPYWFNNEEVARIQQINQNFQEQKDLTEMISACFRKATADEKVKPINSTSVLKILQSDYTTLKITQGAKINVGRAMKELGVEAFSYGNVAHYRVVPTKPV